MGRGTKSEGDSQKKGLKESATGAVQRLLRRKSGREPTEQVAVRFCPFCGAVLGSAFESGKCPRCNELIEIAPANPTQFETHELEQAVLRYAKKGFLVVRHQRYFVEMRKPKRFSGKWAATWFVAGLPLPGFAVFYPVGYAVWHAFKGEKGVQMFVGTDGKLRIEESK
ncbi:MAG: hypothetical protein IH955_01170 [Chloroflexi bacterium]|nr:hypothetical protein [Chloroflexota bacterium]